jgi:hypothetical protein
MLCSPIRPRVYEFMSLACCESLAARRDARRAERSLRRVRWGGPQSTRRYSERGCPTSWRHWHKEPATTQGRQAEWLTGLKDAMVEPPCSKSEETELGQCPSHLQLLLSPRPYQTATSIQGRLILSVFRYSYPALYHTTNTEWIAHPVSKSAELGRTSRKPQACSGCRPGRLALSAGPFVLAGR